MLKRLALFPNNTTVIDEILSIGGLSAESLAREYGTPLYVYDRATLDDSLAAYRQSLRAHYPGEAHITFAGKAFFCKAIAEWVREQGILADCTGEGEIEVARAGGLPRESIVVHGVNKSPSDLATALQNTGTIVVDNLTELHRVAALAQARSSEASLPDIWLRLLPGVAVTTHHTHTQTGQHGSKFGMTAEELGEAVQFCKQHGLPLNGLHFHQGSNFRDPAPLISAIHRAINLAGAIATGDKWHFCPGGGWGIAYHEDELPQPDIDGYVRLIAETVLKECKVVGLPMPVLHVEPGRSLIARAGVALYRVGVVKRRDERTWLLVDGGMADNPRYALYAARYSCLPASRLDREVNERVSIAGPFCESGDVLIENLPMPQIEEGELIVIPASGAYQLSMSSNYNGARKPAVVWLEQGHPRLIIRRESLADLTGRDISRT